MDLQPTGNTFLGLTPVKTGDSYRGKELHFPVLGFVPNRVRNHLVAMLGEFVGTFLFLFFAFSATQVANTSAPALAADPQGPPDPVTVLYIGLGFGSSLAVNAWIFFRFTGGLFNPAVTLALALVGAVNWRRATLVFVAQLVGAMSAAAVVSALFPGPLKVTTTLGGHTSVVQGLFIEMFLTAELILAIIMLAAEKHKATYLAPVGIGLALFIIQLSGVYFTGASVNPARSFAPCVVLHSFTAYQWIYWVGPALGALLAAAFYRLIKLLEYETVNPGQDFDERERKAFVFDEHNAATATDVVRPDAHRSESYNAFDATRTHSAATDRESVQDWHKDRTRQWEHDHIERAGPGH